MIDRFSLNANGRWANRRGTCCMLTGLLIAPGAATAELKPIDFAYGFEIQVEPGHAIYQLTLDGEIYRNSIDPGLADLRVFNARDEVVPYALDRHDAESNAPEPIDLPMFPISGASPDSLDGVALHVSRNSTGTIVHVMTDEKPSSPDQQIVAHLINPTGPDPIDALQLTWESTESFVKHLRIDASDDLTAWRTVLADGTIASLQHDGHQLKRDRLAVPATKATYWRLIWRDRSPDIRSIRVFFAANAGEIDRRWISAIPQLNSSDRDQEEAPDETLTRFLFDAFGNYPIDRAAIDLPEPNSFVTGSLLSAFDAEGPWVTRYRGNFYRLMQDDSEIAAPASSVRLNQDRYWALDVEQTGGGMGRTTPKLRLGYVPHRLLFVARGDPPFRLAYGRYNTAAADADPSSLLDALPDPAAVTDVQLARLDRKLTLGGESKRQPPPEQFPWKRWVVWVVLILGVGIAGRMAWQLIRQIKQPEHPSTPKPS